jgi:hypothetical protein
MRSAFDCRRQAFGLDSRNQWLDTATNVGEPIVVSVESGPQGPSPMDRQSHIIQLMESTLASWRFCV